MAGLLNRIKAYLRGPKGRALVAKAQQAARDPRNQAKAKAAVSRLRSKRR
ncbi:hypothetical protein ACOBQX_30405 [Actinokineospora sp. G85]|nr:hypothetical protein [Actinokineospora pegani]